ncbi:MAG: hypothetical protein IKJ34_08430 [Mailhella sp.]|nr:hypothetical protein [Mailhella sp.]
MAERTGLPEEEVRQNINLVPVLGSGKFGYIQADIMKLCKDPATPLASLPSTASIQHQFSSAAGKFSDAKAGLYLAASSFGLSPELVAQWQAKSLSSPTLRDARFFGWCVAGAGADCQGVTEAVRAGVDNENLFLLLHSVARRLDTGIKQAMGEAMADMGSDEMSLLNSLTQEAFLDRNPEFCAALRADQNKLDALAIYAEKQVYQAQNSMGDVYLKGDEEALQEAMLEYNYCAKALSILIELGAKLPD